MRTQQEVVKPALIGAGKWTLMTATISLETTPVYCRITYPQHSRQVLIYSWKNWAVEACDDFCPIFHQKKRKKEKSDATVSQTRSVSCWRVDDYILGASLLLTKKILM